MNKRIQKKLAKREGEHEVVLGGTSAVPLKTVSAAYQDVEQSVQQLARALAHEAQARSHGALEDLKGRLEKAEASLERTIQKIPGIGTAVAGKLHSATSSLRETLDEAAIAIATKDGLHGISPETHASYGESQGSPLRSGPGQASAEYLDTIGSRSA